MLGMTKNEVLLSDRIILKESLKQNCSLSIVDKLTERIIAFLLITTSESLNLNPSKVSSENLSENHLIIGRMLNYFEDAYIKVLDVESKCSYNSMMSVHPSYRNFGFACQLIRKSEHVAVDLGCRYVIGAFSSSLYAQKVHEKLGYKSCVKLNYANYVDPITGKKPFKIPCPPHTQISSLSRDQPIR
ncbi:unnamed protein product [Clavelina lepadiformis]|uniref:N-acetyltransferase domain-containing protein n=1 Tax=Clavelina lepadiformis TaxID=159417 RepID=A0ABP0F4C9_CLALP